MDPILVVGWHGSRAEKRGTTFNRRGRGDRLVLRLPRY